MHPDVTEIYGNRVRIRACGVLIADDRVLMVEQKLLSANEFWSPPGGGIELGETAQECLKREFREETGLEIEVSTFLFACEFIALPLHAVELFFEVRMTGGALRIGSDPEMTRDRQLIRQTKFMSWNELKSLPSGSLHSIFGRMSRLAEIIQLNGYLTI